MTHLIYSSPFIFQTLISNSFVLRYFPLITLFYLLAKYSYPLSLSLSYYMICVQETACDEWINISFSQKGFCWLTSFSLLPIQTHRCVCMLALDKFMCMVMSMEYQDQKRFLKVKYLSSKNLFKVFVWRWKL